MDATTYLVLEATRSRYGPLDENGLRPVQSMRIVASRTNRPAKLLRDQIAVKITVRVPEGVFAPITPEALIVVPETFIDRRPIEVEAEDPT